MRSLLSMRLFIVGLVLCQLQSGAVFGQKYYMNFAFNNNNPDGAGVEGQSSHPNESNNGGVSHVHEGNEGSGGPSHENGNGSGGNGGGNSGGSGGSGGSGDRSSDESGRHHDQGGHNGGQSAGGGGSAGANENSHEKQHSGGNGHSKADDQKSVEPLADDDDSDSHDDRDRRFKIQQAEETANGPDNDHSHHSSYEISIDDSFGGRYVRSIYESSESHGHSGSNAGSGSGKKSRDSSGGNGGSAPQKLYGEDDYLEEE